MEVISHFLLGLVLFVAAGLHGADAGTVFAPLVLPEALVITLPIRPESVHVVQEVLLPEIGQDIGDVAELSVGVAELLIGSITVIGPAQITSSISIMQFHLSYYLEDKNPRK